MQLRVVALALGLALASSACHRAASTGAPCGAVALRFSNLAHDDLAAAQLDGRGSPPTVSAAEWRRGSIDDATARAVDAQLPAMRDALAQACDDGKWSGAVRDCLTQAADHVAFEVCEQALTADQRRALDRSTRGNSPD